MRAGGEEKPASAFFHLSLLQEPPEEAEGIVIAAFKTRKKRKARYETCSDAPKARRQKTAHISRLFSPTEKRTRPDRRPKDSETRSMCAHTHSCSMTGGGSPLRMRGRAPGLARIFKQKTEGKPTAGGRAFPTFSFILARGSRFQRAPGCYVGAAALLYARCHSSATVALC